MAKSGGQNPTSFSRTMEKVFEDAQFSGVINLSNRKLKEYPKCKKKYDLADTSSADLSRNRLMEIPPEICEFPNLERLNLYNNVIKCLPQALVQLQSLVHLNISRNQLSYLPTFICQLKALEVLLASNNHLVSLPEEIGELENLMDIDISCNEITHLPPEIGELGSLKSLNVRRNMLVELPKEISRVELQTLDISNNRIKELPHEFRHIKTLETIQLENNPLESPPAHICTKGRIHIMKYLQNEAIKEDRKKGILYDMELKHTMRPSSIPPSLSDEFRHLNESTSDKRKRRTVDSGYSTTDSSERSRYSPNEQRNQSPDTSVIGHRGNNTNTILKAAEHVKESRLEREHDIQMQQQSVAKSAEGVGTSFGTKNIAYPAPLTIHSAPSKSVTSPAFPVADMSAVPPITPTHVFIEPNYSPIRNPTLPQHPTQALSSQKYTPSSGGNMNSSLSHRISNPTSADNSISGSLNQSPANPSYLQANSSHSPTSPSYLSPGPALTSSPVSTPTAHSPGDDANLFDGYPADNTSLVDEFTRELQKQRAEYEAKKKKAERMRLERERQHQAEETEQDATRRAAIKLQEQQKALMDKQRADVGIAKIPAMQSSVGTGSTHIPASNGHFRDEDSTSATRKSNSFKEEKSPSAYNPQSHNYRRTSSEIHSPNEYYTSPSMSRRNQNMSQGQGQSQIQGQAGHIQKSQGQTQSRTVNLQQTYNSYSQQNYGSPRDPHITSQKTTSHTLQTSQKVSPNRGVPAGQTVSPGQSSRSIKQVYAHAQYSPGQASGEGNVSYSPHSDKWQNSSRESSPALNDSNSSQSSSSFVSQSPYSQTEQSDEFRRRQGALAQQQRHEAQMARRRIEEEKIRLKQRQKEAVINYVSQRSGSVHDSSSDSSNFSFSRDSTPNTSFDASNPQSQNNMGLPPNYQKALDKLESMSTELNNMNPGFTVRRQLEELRKESEQVEQLRNIIESRLKVKLPDDLPAALKDGVVLCHLANHIKPRSVSSIHVPSQLMPKLSIPKCRRNVENFLEACRRLGVEEEYCCPSSAVLEENGLYHVTRTVQALMDCAAKLKPQHSEV